MINKRVWLNSADSPSTGSIVTYSGPSNWGEDETALFVEIADCHNKVRLHKSRRDSNKDFIQKLELLRDTLTSFIEELESEEECPSG